MDGSIMLAHCSDWHATSLHGASPAALASKRFLGWLSWHLKRGRRHRAEVLESLIDDLRAQQPDHIAVTGDLTNVALESEFRAAAAWLEQLGEPSQVSLVPGNHDAYVRIAARRSWDLWTPYLAWDAVDATRSPRRDEYPCVRIRGGLALVGLCSALPTAPFRATGRLGPDQLERVEPLLADLGERGLVRVVLIHHPPGARHVSGRRRLIDGPELRAALERAGAELVLHGHVHRSVFDELPGPRGPIPIVGVRSASDVGEREERRAQYHLYEIETRRAGDPPRIRVRVRGYDRDSGSFREEASRAL